MRAFNYAIYIEKPPEVVFDFMMDFSNAPRWRKRVRRIDVVTPGPFRAGTELLVTMDSQGCEQQLPSDVWVYDPPRRYGTRNTANNVTGIFEYRLDPEEQGTRVYLSGDVRPHGWMWLALPLLIRQARRRFRDQLSNLKRAMQQRPGVMAAASAPRQT